MPLLLEIASASGPCPVLCGDEPAEALPRLWDRRWRQAAVIADSNTAAPYAAPVLEALRPLVEATVLLEFPAGEQNKTRATKERLEDELLARAFDRHCCIVAVGGGVVLDLAGFVAATYLRGVAHVNVATTLLAQIDAAVGGKTGVNTPHGKNLVGAFHPPRAVLLHTRALHTLPAAELRAGLAEGIKHAVIADAALLDELERWLARGTLVPPDALVGHCVRIKADHVAGDELDHGRRQLLNFGHTAGHAIEQATAHAIGHGEAVAAGMLVEAEVARELCGLDAAALERLHAVLVRAGLPVRPQCPFAAAREALLVDKKNRDGAVHCALPAELGRMARSARGDWTHPVPLAQLEAAWSRCETRS